jgi:hypothetical protein
MQNHYDRRTRRTNCANCTVAARRLDTKGNTVAILPLPREVPDFVHGSQDFFPQSSAPAAVQSMKGSFLRRARCRQINFFNKLTPCFSLLNLHFSCRWWHQAKVAQMWLCELMMFCGIPLFEKKFILENGTPPTSPPPPETLVIVSWYKCGRVSG